MLLSIWTLMNVCAFYLSQSQAEYVYNKVVCAGSTEAQTIQCAYNTILDVRSVTIAVLDNLGTCNENELNPRIGALTSPCKRSLLSEGKDIYKRCHGELSCLVDGSVVPDEHLTQRLDLCAAQRSNVLRFNYTCKYINTHDSIVAVWPLPLPRKIQGHNLEIFSPYYPCYTPAGTYTIDCTLKAPRTQVNSLVSYKITPKLVRIRPNSANCQDQLYFTRSATHRADTEFCGSTDGTEVWNGDVIKAGTINDLHIIYKGGIGAKYWLLVEASQYGNDLVKLTMTCTGLETIAFMSSDSGCTPLVPPPLNPPIPINTPTSTSTSSSTPTPTPIPTPKPAPTVQPETAEATSDPTEPDQGSEPNKNENQQQIEDKDSSNGTLLWGVLGGVLGLVVLVGCIAAILFIVIRKRKKDETNEETKTGESCQKKPRPKSIQKIMDLVKPKKKEKNVDEEQAEETVKPEIKEKPTKPPKPQKHPRPTSIMKMAALVKNKGKESKPEEKTDAEKEEKVAVVKPCIIDATADKDTEINDDKPPEGSGDTDYLYSVPQKKKKSDYDNAIDWRKSDNVEETVMCENDVYDSAESEKEDDVF